MPAVVEFETAPQMIARLAARYAGTGKAKAALGYGDRGTKTWTNSSVRRTRSQATPAPLAPRVGGS